MTQIGQRQRAEDINKKISDLQSICESVKDLPRDFRVLNTRMIAAEGQMDQSLSINKLIAELKAKVDSQQAVIASLEAQQKKYEQLDELIKRIVRLEQSASTTVVDTVSDISTPADADTQDVPIPDPIIAAGEAAIAAATALVSAANSEISLTVSDVTTN